MNDDPHVIASTASKSVGECKLNNRLNPAPKQPTGDASMEAVLLLIWRARATAEDRPFAARNNLSK